MDNTRLANFMAIVEKLAKDLVALIASMKDFFGRYFEDEAAAEETTAA